MRKNASDKWQKVLTLIEYEFILCLASMLNDEKSNRLEKIPLAPDVALQGKQIDFG